MVRSRAHSIMYWMNASFFFPWSTFKSVFNLSSNTDSSCWERKSPFSPIVDNLVYHSRLCVSSDLLLCILSYSFSNFNLCFIACSLTGIGVFFSRIYWYSQYVLGFFLVSGDSIQFWFLKVRCVFCALELLWTWQNPTELFQYFLASIF